ncbi:Phorbol-ester/DAG-type domain-containing protein [Heracleum sosnowskyi]|uniref:Phorbol-ester/DAG-type domain-containing protein n=1 Tax=Heracleum sosnowskyi TaxID=360622 RepID=A0AAD8I2W3_9APIA|nr:Phorbol-ester/DAG-type domain-containing protein [Heracleum sosnowskyi]
MSVIFVGAVYLRRGFSILAIFVLFEYTAHPQHKLIRCDQTSKPNALFTCESCKNKCNGMFYSCNSCSFYIDLVCAALPNKIKHDSHKHCLKLDDKHNPCDGCGETFFSGNFRCETCDYQIHIGCSRKPGRIKHRWDEHQLCLMYPPVKGHPHEFNCERCSVDINPNHWFYHCRECDTSFHNGCLDQVAFTNIKFGAIVKDDDLHQHSLKISPIGPKFKCGSCGIYNEDYRQPYLTLPILTCVSCKFAVCKDCCFLKSHTNVANL